jgi:hypothetical protein
MYIYTFYVSTQAKKKLKKIVLFPQPHWKKIKVSTVNNVSQQCDFTVKYMAS